MNKPLRIILLAINLVLLVSAGLVLGPAGRSEAVSLDLRPQVGDTQRYQISMTTEAQVVTGQEQPGRTVKTEMSQVARWEVISVEDDAVTVRINIEKSDIKVDGQSVNSGDIPSEKTVRISPDGLVLDTGEVIDLGPWMTSSGAFPAMGQMTPLLPDRKVRPGDEWTRSEEVEMPDGSGTLRLESRSELIALRVEDGKQVAEIKSVTDMPLRMSIDFGDSFGQLPGLPEGSSPKLVMSGSGNFTSTTVHEVESGVLLSNKGSGTYEMTFSFEGVDVPAGAIPTSSFTGKMSMDMKRLGP